MPNLVARVPLLVAKSGRLVAKLVSEVKSPINAEKVKCDGWTDGRTDGWTDGRTDGRMDGQTDGRMDGWTDGRTNGKSPHSTGLHPLSGPLPRYRLTMTQKVYKAGQGYR